MKILIAACFGLLLLLPACRKEKIEKDQLKEFSLASADNGVTYSIKVALPENYNASRQYKTLYVLDPQWDFNLVALACRKQARENGRDDIMVIGVGGGNDRLDDYLPVPLYGKSGRADDFIRFLRETLIPVMERDYQAEASRAGRGIVGHSAGGLCVTYCFTNYPDLFGTYLALSPALWVGDLVVLKNEKANRAANQDRTGIFFLAEGELEEEVMHAPIAAFRQVLQQYYTGYAQQYHNAKGLDHLGSKAPNMQKAIAFYVQHL
ncbi:alpha/beta hydrolase [Taibaiella chishuiensis]|uniref:Alpha/beta superfamily hydrolase n=1 Tax=Taibaiella chishuiensis TaxID=1434707 RepID=A0A2P8D1X4_9BACT|nr:alpha/beta hydrolase-fold protein [Taibaiella chishuiensis]PSK91218.1 hypothetical protein B0I18_106230 [Taibaiella chishuiensis]